MMLSATRLARGSGLCRWEQIKGAVCHVCALEVKPRKFLFLVFGFKFTTLAEGELLTDFSYLIAWWMYLMSLNMKDISSGL